MSGFDPNNTVLTGVDPTVLTQWLNAAQNALQQLMTGGRPISVSYDGKSVTYTEADKAALMDWVYLLQMQLGMVRGRRAMTPFW